MTIGRTGSDFKRRLSAGSRSDLAARFFERRAHQCQKGCVVINDQNADKWLALRTLGLGTLGLARTMLAHSS